MSAIRMALLTSALAIASCGGGNGGDRLGPTRGGTPAPTSTPTAAVTTAPTVTAVSTPRPAIAWASAAALIRSDDGGFTWSDTEVGRFSGLSFAGRDVGWAVWEGTPGSIVRTGDGGRTWDTQFPDVAGGVPSLFAIAAHDALHAVAVGMDVDVDHDFRRTPAIVFTDDGGARWERATLPGFVPSRVEGIELFSVCLSESGLGLAAGLSVADERHPSPHGLVLTTGDAGRTWHDVSARLPPGALGRVACDPSGTLWFLAAGTIVQSSADGGATWQSRRGNLPADLEVWGGAFPGGGVGWLMAVTPNPERAVVAYRTIDDARTWEASAAGGGARVNVVWADIDAVDAEHAVIVAQDQTFAARSSIGRSWATADGGTTWTATEHPRPIDALWDVDLVP